MPVHDWTRVDGIILSDFYLSWIAQLSGEFNNGGIRPTDHYSLIEQHAGWTIDEVIPFPPNPKSAVELGGLENVPLPHQFTVAVRRERDHRLTALVEFVSPVTKADPPFVAAFTTKARFALEAGIHLLVVDLLPPGRHDPHGMHEAILQQLDQDTQTYKSRVNERLTLASYVAGPPIEIFLEHLAVGDPLPEMPLFLHPDRYVNVPLESTYLAAYWGVPEFWRDVLEGSET